MNKTEAKARIEAAKSAIADAEKELAAAKAALEAAQDAEPDGRVIMKPSEVPVGEYFRFVDDDYNHGRIAVKISEEWHVTIAGKINPSNSRIHDDEPVYLTDPYGNAIEPREWLPYGFAVHKAHRSITDDPTYLSEAFDFSDTREGFRYWEGVCLGKKLSPSAAAKLRGMIHKWNQENGGQG